ncbi:hypothetical protein FNH22_30065 [Fulvivirga sp. M361]|uniref:hypothetical protein n=1 Tax=Fulvivirga sp. M361 TaxID=2594266 RepID=UPI00117A81CC|nr:hypothetical protein [Fulvivirga sp. M361]TRX47321.1 hypothetical protein FNH22_30065 [Fulvivirga sp. M361]
MSKVKQSLFLTITLAISGCDFSDRFHEQSKTSPIPAEVLNHQVLKPDHHPLFNKVNLFLEDQEKMVNFERSHHKKNDYLKIIEGQVRAMLKYQNSHGRIIDPVENVEKYYSTPCYAHSVAVLASSGYVTDKALIESGMKALDVALSDMKEATAPGNHGDFFTWPALLAYEQFLSVAAQDRIDSWKSHIEAIQPDKLYMAFGKLEGNWGLVNTAGEFLRARNGFTSMDYVDRMLEGQNLNFTVLGMYNEYGNPLPYDLFPRHYLSGMLQMGYAGKQTDGLKDILWKGAWTSLFIQSPFGELPTGYRSSHHIWNEAEQCVVFEIYASAYAKSGRKKEAGAFKRAAMLSLKSIHQWVREDGSGYIVKNRYPIEKKHGYEKYSVHTCYNMLATSMLAQAWQYADDAIEEFPSPADIGGFVIPILKPFHKIFANANGTYLEYDTKGDKKYNPTGLIRAHIKGSNPQLGPSNGLASYFSGEGINIATGPSWQSSDGSWISLAGLLSPEPTVEVLEENPNAVKFRVTFNLDDIDGISDHIIIIETYLIADGTITVTNEFKGIKGKKRINWPMLVFDGKETVKVNLADSNVSLNLEGKEVNFEILKPQNVKLERSGKSFNYVNGIAEVIYAEFSGNKITYSLK